MSVASLKDVPKESRDHIQYTRNSTMYILKRSERGGGMNDSSSSGSNGRKQKETRRDKNMDQKGVQLLATGTAASTATWRKDRQQ